MKALFKALAAVAGGYILYALWWRKNPSACPYAQRFWLEIPHPIVTRERFHSVIDLQPGERVLEIGPGTGYYTREIAREVSPHGTVEILDLQHKMLAHTMKRVEADGLNHIVVTNQGDATSLPFEDDSFDAVTMTAVLGEIPDQAAALSEIARVLKPGGRYVVGEMFLDPHYVRRDKLTDLCGDAGLSGGSFDGPKAGYFARFVK